MQRSGTLQVSAPGDREIRMVRVFDAPRRLVFEALTKPELLRRWFTGPPGWSLTVCEVDLRVGGESRYVWEGPDGMRMGMRGVLLEIVPPERLVSSEKFDEAWYPGEAVGSIVLTESEGRTTLTQTIVYDSRETRDAVLRTPMEMGVEAGYDQLAAFLATIR